MGNRRGGRKGQEDERLSDKAENDAGAWNPRHGDLTMKDTSEKRTELYNQGFTDVEMSLLLYGDKSKRRMLAKWRARRGLASNWKPTTAFRAVDIQEDTPEEPVADMPWCERLVSNGSAWYPRRTARKQEQ